MAERLRAPVMANRLVARDIFRLSVSLPDALAVSIQPGQFAHFLVPEDTGMHQLRRPLSIAGVQNTDVTFYYRRQGMGTERLAETKPGTMLDMLLPLGRGFTVPEPDELVWLVGGGTGVAALLPLAAPGRLFFMGFRSLNDVFGQMEATSAEVRLALESEGRLVTTLLEEALSTCRPDRIIACGPAPMYRALKKVASGIPTEVSMEERMGCGTGGCACCVVKRDHVYVKSCTDGPVFALADLDEFDEI